MPFLVPKLQLGNRRVTFSILVPKLQLGNRRVTPSILVPKLQLGNRRVTLRALNLVSSALLRQAPNLSCPASQFRQ